MLKRFYREGVFSHKKPRVKISSVRIRKDNMPSSPDKSFGPKDKEGIEYPHHDALVVSAQISNFQVEKCLVDNGSAVDILSKSVFQRMGLSG